MTIEENKALVRRFIGEVINGGNTAAIADFCVPGSMFAGGIEGQIRSMKTAFPDMVLTIDEMVAEGERVAVQVTTRGTNTGPLVGLPAFGRLENPAPPTGKAVVGSGVYVFRVKDGKMSDLNKWFYFEYRLNDAGILTLV